MKKITLIFGLLAFLGCKKVDPDTLYQYQEKRVQYTERITMKFPSIININIPWLDIGIFDVNAEFEEKYKSNNPYLHLVEDVKPIKIKVTLISPADRTFQFIKDKKVYISAPGQPRILLASIQNLADNVGNTIFLAPQSNVRLDNYMTENMDMDIEVTADRSLLQEIQVAIDITVDARVKN